MIVHIANSGKNFYIYKGVKENMRILRVPLMILGVIAILMMMLFIRSFYGSMKTFEKGEELLHLNEKIRAITYFDRSIHWYTPFNPYVEKSARRLWEIGEKAEKDGDLRLALIAYRAIRGGFYAASHFIVPGRGWIDKSEKKIENLIREEREKKAQPNVPDAIPPNPIIPPPNIFWTVILELGLLGWIGSVIGFILASHRHKKAAGTFSRPLVWALLGVVCFSLWILGMFKA
jgi:hypothetical protein